MIMRSLEHHDLLQKPQFKQELESIQAALFLKTLIKIQGEIQSDVYVDDFITICVCTMKMDQELKITK